MSFGSRSISSPAPFPKSSSRLTTCPVMVSSPASYPKSTLITCPVMVSSPAPYPKSIFSKYIGLSLIDKEPWRNPNISPEEKYKLFKENWINNNSSHILHYISNTSLDRYNSIYENPNIYGIHVHIECQTHSIDSSGPNLSDVQPISYEIACIVGPVIAYDKYLCKESK